MESERSLYPTIKNHYDDAYDIFEEVHPFPDNRVYSKSIDLLLKHKTRGQVIAIEVKLNDWTRALRQALLNTPYCHYCYVAMPQFVVERIDERVFSEQGIGLLGVKKGKIHEVVKPKKSKPIRRLSLCNYIYGTTRRKESKRK